MKILIEQFEYDVELADTFARRFLGLMFQKKLEKPLLIKKCNQVHTFFMRFPLDLIFLDDNYKILYKVSFLKPWRFSKKVKGATMVLEIKGGSLK